MFLRVSDAMATVRQAFSNHYAGETVSVNPDESRVWRRIGFVSLLRRMRAWIRTSKTAGAHWLRAARDALLGEMPVLAAGTALFAILATVPTLAAVVGVYGLVADPYQIHRHLRGLQSVL